MVPLFRLPLTLLELALREARGAARSALGLLPWCGAETQAPAPRVGESEPPAGPPAPTASEALRRSRERQASAPAGGPGEERFDRDHVDREATVVESLGPEEDVGATIDVDEPWAGYDVMGATQIVARVRDADPAVKAVVALYERTHKARRTVLSAAEA